MKIPKRIIFIFFSLLFIFFCNSSFKLGDPLAKKNNQANELFKQGKYNEALTLYRDAQLEAPESPVLHYNIGNALLAQKNYEKAIESYLKALNSKDASLQAKTYFNMGNAYFLSGQWLESINSYIKSLEINPDDVDAKYNLEYARKKLKEELEKQKQQMEQQSMPQPPQENEQMDQQQQQQSEEQKEEEGEEEKQAQGASEQEQKEEGNKEEEEAEQQKEEGMTEQEAIMLLDSIADDEKDLQKRRFLSGYEGKIEKDW